ncbi:hypothetical protein [Microbulbifer thermotolerans]|uniref:hypothetical protein n=1 Tax=Microbulbifer thermotolerans TaxID=252514 RepID=UPI00224B5C63|nr:hypothetical protein [Microbulbifer thermotolerans]MCX2781182.1 hypothetical protein [Microbulbifer thermotolerans]MCX2803452.1 hypothetical protein [Microbulbifer thermotolerans]WKT59959.1 hypothetical protein Q2E61_13755 [Microbulbifer thermotolerans]
MNKIFKYISNKSGDNTYYLKSLNYVDEVDLNLYCSLDKVFSVQEIYSLLGDENWRSHLVAYTFALAKGAKEGLSEFKATLTRGSFVSPQLVVAIAMLGERESSKFLLSMLKNPTVSHKSKGAIIAALPYCSVSKASLEEDALDLSEFSMGHSIAEQHLKFWSRRAYSPKQ